MVCDQISCWVRVAAIILSLVIPPSGCSVGMYSINDGRHGQVYFFLAKSRIGCMAVAMMY